ncbi:MULTISPECIES: hypothetical protein [unclassified Brevundimonas]|uniref:hypothetical protein n=1 Tax=unclassified Brevundimonas TaxID=2622653 RepID=UPI0025BAE48C|nr:MULTISPECIES: hypothetical protein [unclassified Brevundimonas]
MQGPNTNGCDAASDFRYDFNPVNLLQSLYERTNFNTTLKYDINDSVEFYGDMLYSTYASSNQLAESSAALSVPVATTGTLSAEVRDLLTNVGLSGSIQATDANLFDRNPPIYESGHQYQTVPSTYDVIGRYFYIGARARF